MSPRTKEQNDAIREMRMNQIMQAAAEVYLEKGIQLEIRDVAVKAELGYGTVYHYYKNKHMLLEDLLWDALNQTESAVLSALTGDAGSLLKAESFSRLLLQKCIQDPSVFILLKTVADNFQHFPGNRFIKLFADFQERIYWPFVETVRDGIDSKSPEKTANLIFGSLVGCTALNIHHNMRNEMDVEGIVNMIFSGIQPKE
ncbi:TetR/AcrR family transcriptional regulator [Paenibacillus doosanensis]|uniref:Transcriptional regulator BetI n=1 Tax=Paenibacillus konkukensis TaxID=2020716 RepID=A0ABY4RFI2_9BACL|nr:MULTISPECIES: TetR/AcrR family transcriptional regulator [Paenibacillus]MCS7461488.1 TetR/AcrR family transcriptional regulator [Paenibacillus doosanensis]UQZ81023.1 transcriptional regulator BetI [Paenibacillus konkukensis]